MHDAMVAEEGEGAEDLDREPTDEGRREAGEAVGLDELVQVDAQQLGDDAEVTSERERVDHSNDKVLLVGVLQVESLANARGGSHRPTHPVDEVLEDLDLDQSLVVEPLLVPNDLDRDHLARLVIPALQYLPERSLAEDVDGFVAVEDVIVRHEEVVAPLVVEAKVVRRVVLGRRLLLAVGADKVDLFVLADLLLLIVGEVSRVERESVCTRKNG